MRKKLFFVVFVLLCLLAANHILALKPALPERYKKWLEEDVVYLITPLEKEVFLKLQTDRERDIFIEAFWKNRDPNPASSENEFKTEHYRRISYANRYFGRSAPLPGWKTDRGRIYIILGEPNDIQRFEVSGEVYPCEIWFYQGKTDLGLPPGFNLVFFQREGVGDYRLYSPTRDGPQALMPTYRGDPKDYAAAYQKLSKLEPSVAQASMSLIPGDDSASLGRPSLASDLLVQKVEVSPQKQVKDKYAQKFLQYKDLVEVEYTANYIDSEALVKVIKDPAGLYFVHFAIEPGRLSVNQYEDKYSTTLRVNGSVLNQESKTIYQFERVISLDFDREKMLTISHQPLNIHDMFPLIPGTYRLSILVKNEASKEFTTLEQNIAVPQDETAARMSSLILGYHVTRTEDKEGRLKPFRLGSFQVYAQPNRVFLKKDLLAVAFQMTNLTSVEKAKGEVDFKFFKEDQEFRSFSRKVSEYPELPNCLEEFSLAEFSPAHYKIQASLLVNGHEVLSGRDEFDVTYQEQMARPWVSSRSLPNPDDPIYDYLVGSQFFNGGKMEEAQQNLEKAYQKKPDSMEIALSLAQVDMARAENAKVEALLLPFFSQAQPPKYELFIALGKAYQSLGQLSKAVDVYDKAISHYGINLNLLNNLGECYFRLGNAKEALRAWEKSLEINPNQPQVKKYVEALKEKK